MIKIEHAYCQLDIIIYYLFMKRKPKLYSLSLFLTKKKVEKKDAVSADKLKEFEAKKIALKGAIDADLYIYNSESERPDWAEYLSGSVASPAIFNKNILAGYSNSGLVVLRLARLNRCMLLAFGYGKSLIKYQSVEQFFGRNVVLNSMKLDKILAMKTRSFDQQPRHRENQGTVSTSLNTFDVDLQTEILQKLTGEYEENFFKDQGLGDETIGQKLTGYDSININTSLRLNDLEGLCTWLTQKFESNEYKTVLPDIDSFCPVKAEDLITKLNSELVARIKNDRLEGLHLSIPYILDQQEYTQFSILGLGRREKEALRSDALSIESFRAGLVTSELLDELQPQDLRGKYRVICFSNQDSSRNRSPQLYRCIFGEIKYKNNTYTLMDGEWYLLERDFIRTLTSSLNRNVKDNFLALRPYDQDDEHEYGYNKRQCEGTSFLLFDQSPVKLRGRGKVEICDILCPTGALVHVKRYTASSTLSHLFAQAYVSIKSLMEDETFKDRFLEKIENARVRAAIKSSLNKRTATIVLAILMNKTKHRRPERKISNLPVFSLVNLQRFVREIEGLGFDVKIQFIFHD